MSLALSALAFVRGLSDVSAWRPWEAGPVGLGSFGSLAFSALAEAPLLWAWMSSLGTG